MWRSLYVKMLMSFSRNCAVTNCHRCRPITRFCLSFISESYLSYSYCWCCCVAVSSHSYLSLFIANHFHFRTRFLSKRINLSNGAHWKWPSFKIEKKKPRTETFIGKTPTQTHTQLGKNSPSQVIIKFFFFAIDGHRRHLLRLRTLRIRTVTHTHTHTLIPTRT